MLTVKSGPGFYRGLFVNIESPGLLGPKQLVMSSYSRTYFLLDIGNPMESNYI
jgi:hypothetical protein